MTESKLAMIARSMRGQVESQRAHAYKRLPAGLEIVMQSQANGRWRLAMAREAPAQPSEVEVGVVCEAFGVPSEARLERLTKWSRNRKSQREIKYNVAELTWTERAAI